MAYSFCARQVPGKEEGFRRDGTNESKGNVLKQFAKRFCFYYLNLFQKVKA